MARYRHGLGDRTVSVAWTAWRGLGMGSTSGFVAAQLDALGMDTIGSDEAILALDLAMRGEQANIVVLPVLPAAASVPMLADVAPADTEDPGEHVEPAELDPQSVTEHVVAADLQFGLVFGRQIVADRLQVADQVVERGILADVDEILDASRHWRLLSGGRDWCEARVRSGEAVKPLTR